jgi:hypothetical protein
MHLQQEFLPLAATRIGAEVLGLDQQGLLDPLDPLRQQMLVARGDDTRFRLGVTANHQVAQRLGVEVQLCEVHRRDTLDDARDRDVSA